MNGQFVVAFVMILCTTVSSISVNDRPIIGILTEELDGAVGKCFIMAYYVKYIEASGARVVPIRIYKSREYYKDILGKINGVLIPGGGDIWNSKGFGRTGKLVINIATEMNDKGDYFPLWGTCLGFELLNLVVAKKMWMTSCSADDWPTNIELVKGFNSSRMFSNITREMETMMLEEKVAIHFHHWCFTPQNYNVSGLNKYFRVLATNEDSRGETFVSIVEAYKYPFYGVSFHPEKILFEWTHQNISIPHSPDAVRVSQFFSRFFVNEARKNSHRFSSKSEENSQLIYNYNPKIVDEDPSVQMYIFS